MTGKQIPAASGIAGVNLLLRGTRHARAHIDAHASHVRRFTLTDVELVCYGTTLPRDTISILSVLYGTYWFPGRNAFHGFATEVKRFVRPRSNPRSKPCKPADKMTEMTHGGSVKKTTVVRQAEDSSRSDTRKGRAFYRIIVSVL